VHRETRKGTNVSVTVRHHAVQVVSGVQARLRSDGETTAGRDVVMIVASVGVNETETQVGNVDAVTRMTVEIIDAGPLPQFLPL